VGFLFRPYVNSLMKGNPITVALTVVAAVAVSVGPFYQGVSSGDRVAIAMMAGVGLMIVILLAFAVIDRRANQKKPRPPSQAGRGGRGRP
jgi:hypothetical protein